MTGSKNEAQKRDQTQVAQGNTRKNQDRYHREENVTKKRKKGGEAQIPSTPPETRHPLNHNRRHTLIPGDF
jgi:hypothetical protein